MWLQVRDSSSKHSRGISIRQGQSGSAYCLLCRGYGGSAVKTLAALKEGKTDYQQSGRLFFPDGSFANGGAMRIAPVGLAYRSTIIFSICSHMMQHCIASGPIKQECS